MMSPRQWTDKVYNAGYKDGLDNTAKFENFNDDMRIGAMEEWYERGWTDGQLDRSADQTESLGGEECRAPIRQED